MKHAFLFFLVLQVSSFFTLKVPKRSVQLPRREPSVIWMRGAVWGWQTWCGVATGPFLSDTSAEVLPLWYHRISYVARGACVSN